MRHGGLPLPKEGETIARCADLTEGHEQRCGVGGLDAHGLELFEEPGRVHLEALQGEERLALDLLGVLDPGGAVGACESVADPTETFTQMEPPGAGADSRERGLPVGPAFPPTCTSPPIPDIESEESTRRPRPAAASVSPRPRREPTPGWSSLRRSGARH